MRHIRDLPVVAGVEDRNEAGRVEEVVVLVGEVRDTSSILRPLYYYDILTQHEGQATSGSPRGIYAGGPLFSGA
jgi:hypothetical protein